MSYQRAATAALPPASGDAWHLWRLTLCGQCQRQSWKPLRTSLHPLRHTLWPLRTFLQFLLIWWPLRTILQPLRYALLALAVKAAAPRNAMLRRCAESPAQSDCPTHRRPYRTAAAWVAARPSDYSIGQASSYRAVRPISARTQGCLHHLTLTLTRGMCTS